MADPEHLEILKQGVETWNEWRKGNPDVIPDLIEADLGGAKLDLANLMHANLMHADLSGADLSRADLSSARLSRARLSRARLNRARLNRARLIEAYLSGADLSGAYLSGADLSGADLSGADLSGADLNEADLSEANLIGANLSGARLSRASLNEANLYRANLNKAILTRAHLGKEIYIPPGASAIIRNGAYLHRASLSGANLMEANLMETILTKANLTEANLIKADLRRTDLTDADCYKANLSKANLGAARLISTNLVGATITGACLWETQRSRWSIKDVICEHIFWDQNGEEKSPYLPGEFERLYADKTRVRLFYKDGITPLEIATIPALIKHLEDSHSGSGLRLVTIHEDSGGVVVELAIEDDNFTPDQLAQLKEALETEAQQKADFIRQALSERETKLQLQGEVKQLTSVVDKLIARGGIIMGDTYNVSGQAGAVGQNAHAHDMTFNQIVNHFEKSIDLPALAKQLAELREEMAKDSSPRSAIAQGETAKAEIAAQSGNTSKVMEHLKSAGKWTLDFAKEVGKDLVVEAIKLSMGMP